MAPRRACRCLTWNASTTRASRISARKKKPRRRHRRRGFVIADVPGPCRVRAGHARRTRRPESAFAGGRALRRPAGAAAVRAGEEWPSPPGCRQVHHDRSKVQPASAHQSGPSPILSPEKPRGECAKRSTAPAYPPTRKAIASLGAHRRAHARVGVCHTPIESSPWLISRGQPCSVRRSDPSRARQQPVRHR